MKYLWTTINVENLNESIDFYSDLAGLKVLKRFPARPGIEIVFMGNGIENETLVELIADSSIGTVSFNEFVSIGFAVDSVDAMLDSLKRKNIPVHNGPFETPSFKFFGIKDPDGFIIQFFQQNQA